MFNGGIKKFIRFKKFKRFKGFKGVYFN